MICCYFSRSDCTGITVVEDLFPPCVLPGCVLQKLPRCNRHSFGYHSGQPGCLEQMLYSKGLGFFLPLFSMVVSVWNTPEQFQFKANVHLRSFSLHSKSECSLETSTANALKAGQTIDGPPHFYTHWSTCVQQIAFVRTSKMSNLSRPSVQTQCGKY